MTMRWWMVAAAALLVACGDDTGGSGGSGSGGSGPTGSGGGGGAATTTTGATTSSGEGGGTTVGNGGGGGITTGNGGAGGGDTDARAAAVAACEASNANSVAVAEELGCPEDAEADCEGFADEVAGCEAEWVAALECFDAEITADECTCSDEGDAGGSSVSCAFSEDCDALLSAASDCLP